METNMNVDVSSELRETGDALILAARRFWEVHQKLAGPRAVVWLESTSGHLVVFTRGEYRSQIFRNIGPLADETSLNDPFLEP